jgi:hypothetical protein
MDGRFPPFRKRGDPQGRPRFRPKPWETAQPPRESVRATEDAAEAAGDIRELLRAARGASWYDPGNAADDAALALCRLRRAEAGAQGGILRGDDAVRTALGPASKEELVWLASRMVSYLDETGFPEALEAPLTREARPDSPHNPPQL